MKQAAVVGGGTMGNGIAHVFALHGWSVTLIDAAPAALEKALKTIRANLERQAKKGTIPPEAVEETLGAHPHRRRRAGGGGCGHRGRGGEREPGRSSSRVFQALDQALGPDAILATNTSSISITEIAATTGRPDKVVGMHFMNPVPMMELVEVIRGHATSDATTAAVMDLSRALGKTPVEVNDYPGFVANRVLMPMINEAIFCVMEGVATPEAIDTVMKLGMAHPMGPLALADFIGLDVCLAILEVLHRGLGDDKYRPCPLLRRMVAAGHLGRKSGQGFYDYASEVPTARLIDSDRFMTPWISARTLRSATSRSSSPTIPPASYVGIVAIHDTTLGPALGGTRLWNYASIEDAPSSTRCAWRAA